MNLIRLLVLSVLATLFVISAGAHPGPERHPIEQELFDLEAQLKADIRELEGRLNARFDSLSEPDEEAIAVVVASTVNEALVEITRTSKEMESQMEELVANNRRLPYYGVGALAFLFAAFIGMFGYFQGKLKASK